MSKLKLKQNSKVKLGSLVTWCNPSLLELHIQTNQRACYGPQCFKTLEHGFFFQAGGICIILELWLKMCQKLSPWVKVTPSRCCWDIPRVGLTQSHSQLVFWPLNPNLLVTCACVTLWSFFIIIIILVISHPFYTRTHTQKLHHKEIISSGVASKKS